MPPPLRLVVDALRPPPPLPPGSEPAYTIVFPPTMLWTNHQRPHHVLTQLARRHDVRCLFNDWTVGRTVLENGRLIVSRHAFRSSYHEGPLVYYFSIPEKVDLLKRHRLDPDLVVFELMDLPAREFESWQARLPEALERADLVRTTHPGITRYLESEHARSLAGKSITTSHNGVDLELFDPSVERARPPELAAVERPVLGFYGNLDGWIDWELMSELAGLPDYRVVVVGGTEGMAAKVPPALRETSILWVDKQPVHRIPDFLAAFDVTLFPFVVNEMTDAVDPLKVWEYLAFGKPVLATPTAFAREREDVLHVVDRSDLAGSVATALSSGGDPAAVERRVEAAATRDWGAVADLLHQEIVAALNG